MGAAIATPKTGDIVELLIKKADYQLLKAKRLGKGPSEIAE
jgi:predicted signal transduction protein with EAL and GGDEF domain